MPKLQTSHKVLLVGILALCVSVTLYWIMSSALVKKSVQYAAVKEAQAQEEYIQQNEAKAQEVLTLTADVRASLEKYFVPSNYLLELLAMIDGQLPRISGVTAKVVDGGITKEDAGDKEDKKNTSQDGQSYVRIAINVKGDWSNAYHYLLLLEHMPYAATLEKVVLTKSQTGGEHEWAGDIFLRVATVD